MYLLGGVLNNYEFYVHFTNALQIQCYTFFKPTAYLKIASGFSCKSETSQVVRTTNIVCHMEGNMLPMRPKSMSTSGIE